MLFIVFKFFDHKYPPNSDVTRVTLNGASSAKNVDVAFPIYLNILDPSRFMKYRIPAILALLILFSACAEQSKIKEDYESIPLPERRGFDMALSPVFVLEDIQDRYKDVMEELASASDVYFIQGEIIWDFEKGADIASHSYETDWLTFLEVARTLELKKGYVGISVLTNERDRILENPFSSTFSDEKVRKACKNMVERVISDFEPKYLCFGVEVSGYYHKDPADFQNFVSLYNEIYSIVKGISPETVVFPTFHYEEFLGVLPWNPHKESWELINELRMDAFAISTYPYMVYSLEDIPRDYYTQIRKYTDLPIVIAESGFASQCCGKTVKDLHGSEEAQMNFLIFLLESIEEMNPLLWVYWSLYDYEPLSWGGTDQNDVFNSIGLHYADGTPKPAFHIWMRIFRLPVSNPTER